ncbi:hypothetical protein FNV43_RR26332 [Rhamnella rubrinervis]|uniref:DUF7912 domain-containing protein n=1 Tax=Rhamnella rubrinervis TaxID=2594499 RepID=A0A8K0DJI6_9ROSA|nr:hypothetical protein FNV43_RR26332 [Rhamnella rubrinervis]
MNNKSRIVENLVRLRSCSSSPFRRRSCSPALSTLQIHPHLHNPSSSSSSRSFPFKPSLFFPSYSTSSSGTLRFFNTKSFEDNQDDPFQANEDGETTDGWEEEDVTDPEIGDGGDGGGVVLNDVPWGDRALSIALEILSKFGDDMKLFSFKTTPKGYVYLRLDKLSEEYGCPSMEELERYNQEYKNRLDEVGALGDIPDDLAIEVSSPGAERLLKVPDDLDRFKEMPMRVCYIDDSESKCLEKNGVFLLESIETESCIWKLANVKENRDPLSKGRPLSRKQKDWRLELPFLMHKRVSLYLDY